MKLKYLIKLPEPLVDCHNEDGCSSCESYDEYNPCAIEIEAHNMLLDKIGEIDIPSTRDEILEECAQVAEHQKTICGLSMSRKSTCDDIAANIRKLKSGGV